MIKRFTLLTVILLLSVQAYSQTVTHITTSDGDGMDAHTWLTSSSQNFGQNPIMAVRAWTENFNPQTSRAYFYFDLTDLPSDAIISKAIFTVTSDGSDSRTQDATDPDSIVLNSVSQLWDENSISWDNAPSVDANKRVAIMQNSVAYPTYKFDVTDIVKFWHNNPSDNYGVRLAFKNEIPYTIFYVASGENTNTALHPDLEITYTQPSGIEKSEKELFSVATLDNGQFMITGLDNNHIESYTVYNTSGQQIKNFTSNGSTQIRFDISSSPSGLYILEVRNKSGIFRKSLLKN